MSVLEGLALESPKTRHAAALLSKLGAGWSTLVVLPETEEAARRAFRNLPGVRLVEANAVSAYDLVKFRRVVVLRNALSGLARRCVPESSRAK